MRITIGGDVSIRDCEELFAEGKSEELFGDIIDIFKSSNRAIVNLECAITDKDTKIKKIGPCLKAPLNTARTLRDAGITDCVLSNNHIFDFGVSGISDTLRELKKVNLSYTGFGENELDARKDMIITDGKIKVAIIAVCEHEYSYALKNRMGARVYDPYDTSDDIVSAKSEADYVIVIYHGGKENCRYPSPRLLKACRSMIKHGADVVLCQHSHCIGCYEEFMGGHILYGQGNFHFIWKELESEEDGGYMWNTGLLAQIDIDDSLKIKFIPCLVDGNGIRLAKGDEAEKLMSELEARNEELKNGTWRKHWHQFALSQERYRIVGEELYEELAHFFDCEAHTDMCKEIYQTYNMTNELN